MKTCTMLIVLSLMTVFALAGPSPKWVPGFDEPKLRTKSLEITGSDGEITLQNGDLSVGDDLTVGDDADVVGDLTCGTITVDGKAQVEGELEANSDVDINLGAATEEITIDQTNTVGVSGVPMCLIRDARTGANANQTNEATIVMATEGTYALCVGKGGVDFAGTLNVEGDTTTESIYGSGTFIEQDSSAGAFRIGYPAALGWQFATTDAGATMVLGTDYARTGYVTRVSVTSAGIGAAGISGVLCASMPVSATYSATTNGQITVQAKDPAGANLARATGFEFWFTTYTVVTTPATNEIESFSVQNGDMRMYREIASAVPTYVAQTDSAGLFRVNTVVYTNGASSLTNYFHVLGPNGYYTNFVCAYNP